MVRSVMLKWLGTILACIIMMPVQAVDLTGAGASFPYPVYAKWAARYHAETGARVNYQSIGSGGGQQQVIAGTVDFGASDDPMDGASLTQYDLLQFPALVGGIVPVLNVSTLRPGELRLTGEILANIFLGKVTRWDDPAIQELNPGLDLPKASIIVVHRSDGSGTTFNFSHYLAQVSPQWKDIVGVGKAIKWPTGHGGKGNEGVSAYVKQLKNSIGYVEFAYARQNDLAWVQLENRSGQFVQPSIDSFFAAAQNADWQQTAGMGVVLTNVRGEAAWPISAATFVLVPKLARKPRAARQVLEFFRWAFVQGQDIARQLDYVPMPDTVSDSIFQLWHDDIRGPDDAVIWPLTAD